MGNRSTSRKLVERVFWELYQSFHENYKEQKNWVHETVRPVVLREGEPLSIVPTLIRQFFKYAKEVLSSQANTGLKQCYAKMKSGYDGSDKYQKELDRLRELKREEYNKKFDAEYHRQRKLAREEEGIQEKELDACEIKRIEMLTKHQALCLRISQANKKTKGTLTIEQWVEKHWSECWNKRSEPNGILWYIATHKDCPQTVSEIFDKYTDYLWLYIKTGEKQWQKQLQ